MKKIESIKSKKFELNEKSQVFGGLTTYGPYYNTNAGTYSPNGESDTARTTYNKSGMPQPNAGQDDLTWKF